MKMRDKNLIRMLITTFFSIIIMAVVGITYTGQSIEKNNQKWCDLLTTLDSTYTSLPPTSELGRKVARSIHNLKEDYGC